MFTGVSSVKAASLPDAGFEDGTFAGWEKGAQTGTLGTAITGNGTGVTIFTGSRTFTHGSRGAMGSPTKQDGSENPYYAPAVDAGSWTFGPNNDAKAVALQPVGQIMFSDAMAALGLSGAPQTAIQNQLTADRNASGFGSPTPTNAAWITREVQLTAGETYTMSWNYLGTDYVPYNDGSVTALVPVTITGTPVITVNNYVQSYALLGFTNPGTGDYSTNSFGATGWQTSTYEVSITGTYKLGFAVFNLGDTSLSPVLMVDSEAGSTQRCVSGTCTTFGGVEPNNETAPTVPPTTVAETTTTTSTSTTSTSTTSTSTTSTTTTTLPPAPTSLVVTSLDDTTANGTLRWAITQANANTGGIYDSITFDTNGTISLASSLPSIVGTLTITGNGRTNTIIDGNNSYRPFYVGQGNSLTVSNMTLKKGLNGDGGLIFNTKGTVSATNVRFTGMSGGTAVFNKEAGSVSTYTNSTFDYLNVGISADHGSTPSLAAGVTTWEGQQDSLSSNRTYVNNCVFDSNNSGISSQRFTKVENSTFTNNSYAANIQGWNRSQVLDSSFSNNGIGVYHNAWINTTANMGTNLRLIDGNTFTNNGIAVYLDDTYTNGQKNQNWATVSNNSWDANGVWVRYYQWNGTTNAIGTARPYTTGTVFTQSLNAFPDTIGAPSNLTATDTGTSIVLSWSAPTTGGYLPERYAIGLNTAGQNGWGVATGNVGDANALNTTYTIDYSLLESLMPSGTTWLFHIRSDNDTFGKYSANSNVVSVQVGAPASTTTTTEVTELPTTTTQPVVVVVPVEPEPETIYPEEPTPTIEETLPEEIEIPATEEEVIPETSVPDSTVDLPSFGETVSGNEMNAILDDVFDSGASVSDIADSIDAILSADLTPKAFDALLDTAFSDDIDPELYAEVLDTMLSADLSDAELDKVLDSAFSATTSTETMVASLGTLLESGSTDVSLVMDAVFDADISVETAGAVVEDLLSSDLSIAELGSVFDSVFDGDLSAEDTVAMAETILAEPLSDEEFSTVINAIFDEVVSDEVLVGTIGAVLDTPLTEEKFAEVVNVLENANITNDQVSQVVDLIVSQDGGVSSDQATELATSPKVLESINGDQATEVFNAVVVAEVTEEAGAQIAEALIDAATEVKEAFEEEINVFAGVFDTYVALGSNIDVGDRRTVIAVGAAVTIAGAASAMGGGTGGSPSSPNNNNPSNQNTATRKPDEETEASGEIAGDGVEWIAKLSVYKYVNGVKVFSLWGFMKKFTYGFLNMGFTLAGSLVVYLTLSGTIQKIAGVSTILAFAGAMYLHMKEPESE
jgi:hypothetical protein